MFSGRFDDNLGQLDGDVLVSSYADECENTIQMTPKEKRVFEVPESSESVLISLL